MDHDLEMAALLRLVEAGLGTRAIAARLGCDRAAVQRRLAAAIARLDARSVPDAVRIAGRRGLLAPTGSPGLPIPPSGPPLYL